MRAGDRWAAAAWLARAGALCAPAAALSRSGSGMWPAVAVIVGFAWLELVYVERDRPSTLAALSLGYFLVMLAGMVLFGVEEWGEQADGFGAYFSLLSGCRRCARRTAASTCAGR